MSQALNIKTDLFLEVEGFIKRTVKDFLNAHGRRFLDFEDCFSISQELFLKSIERYNPERGAFTTFLRKVIWTGLTDEIRKCLRRQNLNSELSIELECASFDLNDFLFGLSEEAKEICRLAVFPPKELEDGRKEALKLTGPVMRRQLRDYLTDHGWSLQTIQEVFLEIQEAL